jgi:thiosulfate dehydrogenase (quinone) large subunit
MTRNRTYALTAVAAGLYVLLCWIFGTDMFKLTQGNWWDSADRTGSAIFTYVFLALIVAAGIYQASRLPAEGVSIERGEVTQSEGQTEDPHFWRLLSGNVYWALLWLPLRFYVGQAWLSAGEEKLRSSKWMDGGSALQGYWKSSTAVPATGSPRITYDWYRHFLTYMLNHEWYTWFAKLIAIGEFLVGIGLIVGGLVAIAAFFGTLMNMTYLLAGSTSSNPVLFGLTVFLILGWKVVGYWGLDRWLLPALGAPWKVGTLFGGEGIHEHTPTPGRVETA